MATRFDESDAFDEDWEEDPDAPQECDLTDDDETPTVPCPNCRRPVADCADRCPHCGDWIVPSAGSPARRNPWFIALIVLAALIILTWALR